MISVFVLAVVLCVCVWRSGGLVTFAAAINARAKEARREWATHKARGRLIASSRWFGRIPIVGCVPYTYARFRCGMSAAVIHELYSIDPAPTARDLERLLSAVVTIRTPLRCTIDLSNDEPGRTMELVASFELRGEIARVSVARVGEVDGAVRETANLALSDLLASHLARARREAALNW